ncbi:MAG: EFR1 family ferrodoxin [Turicibacter sp.]|nr:EFR1 family ferrodoxin [Turicibacter sp.]
MKIFYFTGTGNCLAVAKLIGGELISIPQAIHQPDLVFKDDAIGFIFPTYGLSAPNIVLDFFEKARFEADYVFAIGTYGNYQGGAVANFKKMAAQKGIHIHYGAHLLMVDNYLPMFEITKQIALLPKKKTKENTARIVADIQRRKTNGYKASPIVRVLSKALAKAHPYEKFALGYFVDDKCTKCKTCIRVCPTHNVTLDGTIQFGSNCTGCSACIHLCPYNAIHLKSEKSSARWRNPETGLKEIMAANNQT